MKIDMKVSFGDDSLKRIGFDLTESRMDIFLNSACVLHSELDIWRLFFFGKCSLQEIIGNLYMLLH